MGAGGSLEAAYDLKASVPAGDYHCIIDAIIIRPVDVTFDLIWRRDGVDMVLATWTEHYEPNPGVNFDAQPYEVDMPAQAIDFEPNGRAGALDHFGHYEDAYVRTPQGWRFKSRRFVNESQAALKAPR